MTPEIPARLSAALAGRYHVKRELGTGGMATVYLAKDVKHERDVAIKVLHPELGAALGGDRFLAEIKTTARLQHPHILPLLDSGDAGDGLLWYAMPYVHGETLRRRLDRERQLPIDDALRIAREAADALQHAHAQGIVHRDIKPENILLRDGHALVADFGIALAVQQAGGPRMTQTGLSLGTPSYMSPEQAMGERTLDARTDVYALGAVTYEMLTGEAPFTGPTVQAIVAKVVGAEPERPSLVRKTVPPAVEVAVLTALAKLPADRHPSAAAFAAALDARQGPAASGAPVPAVRRTARWRDPVVLILGALVLGLGGLVAARMGGSGDEGARGFPYRFVVADNTGPGVLSPDSRSVVYSLRSSSGEAPALWIRQLDQLESREIAGTKGVDGHAAFSPDGQWLAFVANRRRIMKVPVTGGTAVPLGEVEDFGGLDWGANGDIVVGPGVVERYDGLLRVRASGGPLERLTETDSARGELSHQAPRILSDGQTVLFAIWRGTEENAEIAVTDLADGRVTPIGIRGLYPLGMLDGQLVYSSADGRVMAVPFDLKARRATGTAIVVQDSVRQGAGKIRAAFLSQSGGFLYARGAALRRLVWADRSGATRPALDALKEYSFPRLSPDGRRVAVSVLTNTRSDIWVGDFAAGTLSPVSTAGTARNPVWTPDGRSIGYVSTQGGRSQYWQQPVDRSGPAALAADSHDNMWQVDLSADGQSIVYNAMRGQGFDVQTFPVGGSGSPRPLANAPGFWETSPRFSPDGRWVAFISDESGRREVFVTPFAAGGGRVQISANGGVGPAVWRRDGHELYFWDDDQRLMAVSLAFSPEPRVVSRTPLFSGTSFLQNFDVAADGSRFLLVERERAGVTLVVVPQWREELRAARSGGERR